MPVKVKGPDGKTYSFPDGTTKETAVAYFKKKNVSATGTPGVTAQPAAATPASFRSRIEQGTGIPLSKETLEQAQPDNFVKYGGPAAAAVEMAGGYAKNLYKTGKEALGELSDANRNVLNDPNASYGANVGKSIYALENFLTRGVLGPVGGEAVQNFGEDIGNKDLGIQPKYGAAGGDAIATLVNALMLRKSRPLEREVASSKLAAAAGGDMSEIRKTLPDLRNAVRDNRPETVGDFLETVNEAKRKMNTESGLAMQNIRGYKSVPTDVADRIKSRITSNMDMTPEGRADKQRLLDAAKPFETQEWNYEQLDQERGTRQQRLTAYHNKSGTGKYQDLRTNPDTAADFEVVHAIQDIVYPQMDAAAGKPQGYFRNLKHRQSNLITLESDLKDRIKQLEDATAISKGGGPIGTGSNLSVYASNPTKVPGVSYHKLQNLIFRPDPMAKAGKRVRQAFSTGSPTAKGYVYSLPVRTLIIQNQDQTPADLRERAKANQ